MTTNVLILFGGGGPEHEVSKKTAEYLISQIDSSIYTPVLVEIQKDLSWIYQSERVELSWDKKLKGNKTCTPIQIAIPWLHGHPGESGHIPAFFELIQLPYLGCESESHTICFNKVLTKLWCEKLNIPTTKFEIITSMREYSKAENFFNKYGSAFIKASNQGSSVGCYPITEKNNLHKLLEKAFTFSNFVIIEELLEIRELEISLFDYEGKTHVTNPCEIKCPDNFYSYDEKYSGDSKTQVELKANLSPQKVDEIKKFSMQAYKGMKLGHLCRMDFFLDKNDRVILNEINTYPGLTPISMFPKMMDNYGISFKNFLSYQLKELSSFPLEN